MVAGDLVVGRYVVVVNGRHVVVRCVVLAVGHHVVDGGRNVVVVAGAHVVDGGVINGRHVEAVVGAYAPGIVKGGSAVVVYNGSY